MSVHTSSLAQVIDIVRRDQIIELLPSHELRQRVHSIAQILTKSRGAELVSTAMGGIPLHTLFIVCAPDHTPQWHIVPRHWTWFLPTIGALPTPSFPSHAAARVAARLCFDEYMQLIP